MYFFDGSKQNEIAEREGISKARISQIINRLHKSWMELYDE